jgi:hypothetical protein
LIRIPPRMKISHSTMQYRKVMTKLCGNNVTYAMQTMTSMNYVDSSRKNVTYILNKSQ